MYAYKKGLPEAVVQRALAELLPVVAPFTGRRVVESFRETRRTRAFSHCMTNRHGQSTGNRKRYTDTAATASILSTAVIYSRMNMRDKGSIILMHSLQSHEFSACLVFLRLVKHAEGNSARPSMSMMFV